MKKHIDEVRKQATRGSMELRACKYGGIDQICIGVGASKIVALCGIAGASDEPESIANAALFLHCVNTHMEMFEAMNSFVRGVEAHADEKTKASLAYHLRRHKEAIEAAQWVEVPV